MRKTQFKKERLKEAIYTKYSNYEEFIDEASEKGRFGVKLRMFKNDMRFEEMPFDRLLLMAQDLNVSMDYLVGYIGKDNSAVKYPFSKEIGFVVKKEKLKSALNSDHSIHYAIYGTMEEWLETCGISKSEIDMLRQSNNRNDYPFEDLRSRLVEATLKTYNSFLAENDYDSIRKSRL